MTTLANHSQCVQARENLERLYRERNIQDRVIAANRQALGRRKGELAEARNLLSRAVEAIAHLSADAVTIGVDIVSQDRTGFARNSVGALVRWTGLKSEQETKIENLKRLVADDEAKLRHSVEKLEIINTEIGYANDFIRRNRCG